MDVDFQAMIEGTVNVLKRGWQTLVIASVVIWAALGLAVVIIGKILTTLSETSEILRTFWITLGADGLPVMALFLGAGLTLNAVRKIQSESWDGDAKTVLQDGKSHVAGLGVFSVLAGLVVMAVPFLWAWAVDDGADFARMLFYVIAGAALVFWAYAPAMTVDGDNSPIDAMKTSIEKAKESLPALAVVAVVTLLVYFIANKFFGDLITNNIIKPTSETKAYLDIIVISALVGAVTGPIFSALLVGATESDSGSNGGGGGDSATATPHTPTPTEPPAAPESPISGG